MTLTRRLALLVALSFTAARGQDTPQRGAIAGVIRSDGGVPLAGIEVQLPAVSRTARTDSLGAFRLSLLPPGRLRLTVAAVGFRFYEVVVRVPASGTLQLDVELTRHIQHLTASEVRAKRPAATTEEEHERELFAREILPAATTLSRREMRDLPIIIEPDVLRSLQAVPGVVAINDFDARLHVRGGGPDENLFLLDGAPVYGAYHMFGMTGAFNVDAVENVEFLRGFRPARYGGVLSSVIDIRQRDGEFKPADATEGGLSMLGVRFTHRGATASERFRYMFGVRRTHLDWNPWVRIPYSFTDAQTRLTYTPAEGHEITLSVFGSGDWFDVFDELPSRWGNMTSALRWTAPAWRGWTPSASLWTSAYSARMQTGLNGALLTARSRLRSQGVRVEAEREQLAGRIRVGLEAEHTGSSMIGAPGTFFDGETQAQFVRPIAYVEWDRRLNSVRLSPGLRVVGPDGNHGALIEPRIAARWQPVDRFAFSVGWSRDHQVLSTLRDERTIIPGPPFYFGRAEGMPASRADALTSEVVLRGNDGWSTTIGAFTRRSEDVPRWDPRGARDLSSLVWNDGRSTGAELAIRRFGTRVSGWLGYSYTRTVFRDTSGTSYSPLSDRRHGLNAMLSTRLWRTVSFSSQLTYGSGMPIWGALGQVSAPVFSPSTPAPLYSNREFTIWSDAQYRQPAYARLDIAIRKSFEFRHWGLEPYFTAQNVGRRMNPFMYHLETDRKFNASALTSYNVLLQPFAVPIGVLPTFGFNVRF